MITPKDVKLQLITTLPIYTDIFGARQIATSAIVGSANQVTINKVGHGLKNGDVIMITEAIVKVPIAAVDLIEGVLSLTTSFMHDRTSGTKNKDGYNVAVLEGFEDIDFNDSFDIYDIQSKTSFDVLSSTEPEGDLGYLLEPRSLFLGPSVVTLINADSFSIPSLDALPAAAEFSSLKYSDAQRIYISASLKRAHTRFTQTASPQPTLYIVMGPERASKDRNTMNDAVATVNSQNPAQMIYYVDVTLFACFKVSPTDTHEAAIIQQQVYSELRPALRKAMYAHVFEVVGDSVTMFAAIETDNTPEDDHNMGYYLHSFTYTLPYSITIEQGDTIRRNVSFRDIVLKSQLFEGGQEMVDEIPLQP